MALQIQALINQALGLARDAATGAVDAAEQAATAATQGTKDLADAVAAYVLANGGSEEQAAKARQEVIDEVL